MEFVIHSKKHGDVVVLVDDSDKELIMGHTWHVSPSTTNGDNLYAGTNLKIGYGKYRNTGMHRIILGLPKNKIVDHINRNTLDNRRCNLRVCNSSENRINSSMRSDNTTGFRGVSVKRERKTKIFTASICINKKITHIGYFDTPEEAAAAYNHYAKKMHGEFAILNKL